MDINFDDRKIQTINDKTYYKDGEIYLIFENKKYVGWYRPGEEIEKAEIRTIKEGIGTLFLRNISFTDKKLQEQWYDYWNEKNNFLIEMDRIIDKIWEDYKDSLSVWGKIKAKVYLSFCKIPKELKKEVDVTVAIGRKFLEENGYCKTGLTFVQENEEEGFIERWEKK